MTTVEGTVEDIIFSNDANGYTVCELKNSLHAGDIVTVVGYLPFINVGETLKISGSWMTHPDYGEQFKAESFEKVMPQTTDAIQKYLASGALKGIGPATAQKIVERFGERTLDIIRAQPGRLHEIKGISLDKAIQIGQAFDKQQELAEVVMFFSQYGISPTYAAKIYKVFGSGTVDEIRRNPYKLADEVFGIGFRTADRIAMSLGIDTASKYRICSGIKYVLSGAASGAGHSYLYENELIENVSHLLSVAIDDISDALVALLLDRSICVENDRKVYLSVFHNAETGVCRRLAALSSVSFGCDPGEFETAVSGVQEKEDMTLTANQKAAVQEALKCGVMVITGGPGTGKTTIIKSIISLLSHEGHKVVLAAPTGRAAKRMTEATGFEARTIHRLLEVQYMNDERDELIFARDAKNPIEAGTIVIDEMSMVDVILMHNLLKAVAPGTRLVLVGDVDQLPSVGAGNVLRDIIDSGALRTVKLTEIFRQARESMIVLNAHRVNHGEYPHLNRKDGDFFFMQRRNADDVVKTIVELCCKRLPDTYGYDPMKHIQVLTPMRKGATGVFNLNKELQRALNPPGRHKDEKESRGFCFRVGDRVMQVKNNYDLHWEKAGGSISEGTGVFNGDTGIITAIDKEEQTLTVRFEDDRTAIYDFGGALEELDPAYAITIHKSQGSEFPVAVMPVFPGPPQLMTRNLLYTAITRARELVILVGVENTLGEMVNNEKEAGRNSGLSDKLKTVFYRKEASVPETGGGKILHDSGDKEI